MKKLIYILVVILSLQSTYSQWIECTNGLPEQGGNKADLEYLILKDSIIYATVYYYGNCSANGIYISSDNGDSWEARNSGLNMGFPLKAIVHDGNNMFTGGIFTGVFLSTDNGKSWNPKDIGLKNNIVESFTFHNNDIYVGLDSGIYSSSDNGDNWELKGLGNFRIYSLLSLDSNIFAGIKGGQIFKSSDDGKNWNYLGLSYIEVRCLYTRDKQIYAGTWGSGIYRSTDFGANWNCILPGKTVLSLAKTGRNVFAGAFEDGMYLSTDNGATWKAINNGLNNNYIVSLIINGDYIFAGTQSGLFRAKMSDFGISSVDDMINSSIIILYISPNPSSTNISISFTNTDISNPSISIYNSLGIEIKRINENELLGKSSINITTDEFSSGIYYCTLSLGINKITKSFVVLK